MKIEDRLRQELHDTAEQLVVGPGDYERIVRRGRRRQRLTILAGVAGSALALTGVLVLASLPADPAPVGSSTSTLPPPTTTTTAPSSPASPTALTQSLVTAGASGISLRDIESGAETILASDPNYEAIAWAVGDGAGGLVYVHEITPLPWEQGSIMWLPEATTEPIPLIAPGAGERMVPVDMIDGTHTLLYIYDHLGGSELRTVDLGARSTDPLLTTDQPLQAVAVDGELVAVVSGTDCLRVDFYNAIGGGPIDVGFESDGCLPPTNHIGMAGGLLYSLEPPSQQMVVRELATGDTIAAIEVGDAWQLNVAADGIVALGGQTVTVGRFSDGKLEQWNQFPGDGTIALTSPLTIPTTATLGSGDDTLPCTPHQDPPMLGAQDVPPEVEVTRQLLYNLATSCDLAELAALAEEDGALLGFDQSTEPFRQLIDNARRGFDVASWIIRIFNAEPARLEDGNYAWPAVFVTGSEEDWEAISGILTAAEYEHLRQTGDYLGFRVGIDHDGRFMYALAGD